MSITLMTKTVARSWARRLGLIPTLARIRDGLSFGSQAYEAKFANALLGAIRPGDCVWDVGANLGLYTAQFSDRVGPSGSVVAFEPAPGPFQAVSELRRENVLAMNLALGAKEGLLPLALSSDPLGATHTLVGSGEGQTVQVRVAAGDTLVASEGVKAPNVVKIDVEGFEGEVIRGMSAELSKRPCRAVFCEIHFALLEKRGERHAPSHIEKSLNQFGFATRWIDDSHISGQRS